MDFESCMNNHHLLFLLDLHQIGLLYPNKNIHYYLHPIPIHNEIEYRATNNLLCPFELVP